MTRTHLKNVLNLNNIFSVENVNHISNNVYCWGEYSSCTSENQ